jgi:hypothetical protein
LRMVPLDETVNAAPELYQSMRSTKIHQWSET